MFRTTAFTLSLLVAGLPALAGGDAAAGDFREPGEYTFAPNKYIGSKMMFCQKADKLRAVLATRQTDEDATPGRGYFASMRDSVGNGCEDLTKGDFILVGPAPDDGQYIYESVEVDQVGTRITAHVTCVRLVLEDGTRVSGFIAAPFPMEARHDEEAAEAAEDVETPKAADEPKEVDPEESSSPRPIIPTWEDTDVVVRDA